MDTGASTAALNFGYFDEEGEEFVVLMRTPSQVNYLVLNTTPVFHQYTFAFKGYQQQDLSMAITLNERKTLGKAVLSWSPASELTCWAGDPNDPRIP